MATAREPRAAAWSSRRLERARRPHSHTDGRGKTWSFRYDTFGYPSEQRDPLDNLTAIQFDERGRKLSERDANQGETKYTYDERNRERTRTLPPVAGQTADAIVRTEYDDVLRKRTDIDPNDNATVTSFDLMGRVVRIRNAAIVERNIAYDFNGNKTDETDFRGKQTTYTYDAANRLTVRAEPEGRTSSYGYDENRPRHARIDRQRRGQACSSATSIPCTRARSRARRLGSGWLETAEEYDANGNRTALVDALARRHHLGVRRP